MKELDVLWERVVVALALDLEAHNCLISYQFFEPQATRPKTWWDVNDEICIIYP
jgi:hypothetical protein